MDKVKELLTPFKAHILRTAKAWTAALVGTGVAWLANNGVALPQDVQDAVLVVATFVVTWALTWLIPNKV